MRYVAIAVVLFGVLILTAQCADGSACAPTDSVRCYR